MSKGKMRIYFFSPFCILRTTTNRIFDMRMCDGFAAHNIDVTFVYPYVYMKENISREDVFSSYGMQNKFRLMQLPTPLKETSGKRLFFYAVFFAYFFATLWIMIKNMGRLKRVVIISREVSVILSTLIIKKIFGPLAPFKVVPHLDEVKKFGYKRWAYMNVSGIMPVVSSVRDALIEREGFPPEKFCVMYAPVIDFTKTDCTKSEARKKINYNADTPLIVYTGKIGKGVNELYFIFDAAALLPQYNFIFTGGKEETVEYFQNFCKERGLNNISFSGFFPDSTFVRYYQLAADALVSYYNRKDHMVEFNFPQKLQEYISTHNPVVTPDFEATRDVINNDNAFIVEPDNPKALAEGLREAIENKELAKKKSDAAFEASKTVTFEYRTQEFLKFFETLK